MLIDYVHVYIIMYIMSKYRPISIKVLTNIHRHILILMNIHIDEALRFLACPRVVGWGLGCNNQRKQGTDTMRACGAMIANRRRCLSIVSLWSQSLLPGRSSLFPRGLPLSYLPHSLLCSPSTHPPYFHYVSCPGVKLTDADRHLL